MQSVHSHTEAFARRDIHKCCKHLHVEASQIVRAKQGKESQLEDGKAEGQDGFDVQGLPFAKGNLTGAQMKGGV